MSLLAFGAIWPDEGRQVVQLNGSWESVAGDKPDQFSGFENMSYDVGEWEEVTVPHNWDQYEGYRRLKHGNRHGYSWYRKHFDVEIQGDEKRYFLFFEGVGSYATVFLNGKAVGKHAGGRTTFTIDVTDAINPSGRNLLAVKADHPANIQDLPWVCGGCSDEYGFSEGSQPMGIFRPVSLIITDQVRVEPFGVHIWNDTAVSEQSALLNISTEIKNYGGSSARITLVNSLLDARDRLVGEVESSIRLRSGEKISLEQMLPELTQVTLWSPEEPYLYRLVTEVYRDEQLADRVETPYGIRWVKWKDMKDGTRQFILNGQPVFINGTAEYEHHMGQSHAFTAEMIQARVGQMRAAGFNAFRDAHQPHNSDYHQAWDSLGILWWPQMAAHIWYDTPEFRENFKNLLKDWVKERRNSPSAILWGLENESTLPESFARECTQLIREMDPTSPTQRLVTTCNGGSGTDWDVPQNWTGTYGGDPDLYHEDIQRQQLIGEYGAWRTLDMHTEGPFDQKGPLSEDRMTLLMERKVLLADSVKGETCGHFQWIFSSHENPGRNQSGEGFRELDRVGPVNYKGLFSSWGEPLDTYYMYRANFAPSESEPMTYIVSHTWPNRWDGPGIKDGVVVYSNCDEVELFNGERSLGRQSNPGRGRHFQWDSVDIQTNLITAVGYVGGMEVNQDHILMNHLPKDPLPEEWGGKEITQPGEYVYRVNCGGPDYIDGQGNLWMADVHQTTPHTWGSVSWTDEFEGMSPFYASQRRTFDPILNTREATLYQTFRYGMNKLRFHFPIPDGTYKVDLHFVEPWYGTGGGLNCANWRNFDVAINGQTVIDDLDIWSEAGHDRALIKTVEVSVAGGELILHFPEVKSGQALISAIAIRSEEPVLPANPSPGVIQLAHGRSHAWLDWGDAPYGPNGPTLQYLPPELFGAEWIPLAIDQGNEGLSFDLNAEADVYIGLRRGVCIPAWLEAFDPLNTEVVTAGNGRSVYDLYKKRFEKGTKLHLDSMECREERSYLVFVQPATQMEPPYDLKTKVPYDDDVALLRTSGLQKQKKFGLGCVTFVDSTENVVAWPIKTGVADYHAIHFKFLNEATRPVTATFRLVAADGTVLQTSTLDFTVTPKYQEITTFTDTMINAGDYYVELVASHARGLSIRGIRVQ